MKHKTLFIQSQVSGRQWLIRNGQRQIASEFSKVPRYPSKFRHWERPLLLPGRGQNVPPPGLPGSLEFIVAYQAAPTKEQQPMKRARE
jgi:hypothetical protein